MIDHLLGKTLTSIPRERESLPFVTSDGEPLADLPTCDW